MIARTWHGTVKSTEAAEYGRYLRKTGVEDLQATSGNRGVYVLRLVDGDRTHFVMISLWNSRNDISAFAGEDIECARYYPEDEDYLLELEPCVTHYEVLVQPEPVASAAI